jgi:hypothetical protein
MGGGTSEYWECVGGGKGIAEKDVPRCPISIYIIRII